MSNLVEDEDRELGQTENIKKEQKEKETFTFPIETGSVSAKIRFDPMRSGFAGQSHEMCCRGWNTHKSAEIALLKRRKSVPWLFR